MVHIPQFDLCVLRARENQVTGIGKEFECRDAFGVARVRVEQFFGEETGLSPKLSLEIHIQVLGNMEVSSTHVVSLFLSMELGLFGGISREKVLVRLFPIGAPFFRLLFFQSLSVFWRL